MESKRFTWISATLPVAYKPLRSVGKHTYKREQNRSMVSFSVHHTVLQEQRMYSLHGHSMKVHSRTKEDHGPRAGKKQKQPEALSSGIIPPPLLVSIASRSVTTSSMSGRFSGCGSQHLFMMFAKEWGQHLGMCGRKFCQMTWDCLVRLRSRSWMQRNIDYSRKTILTTLSI